MSMKCEMMKIVEWGEEEQKETGKESRGNGKECSRVVN